MDFSLFQPPSNPGIAQRARKNCSCNEWVPLGASYRLAHYSPANYLAIRTIVSNALPTTRVRYRRTDTIGVLPQGNSTQDVT